MAGFRACESCGTKMPFGKRRTVVNGQKVCDGCNPNKPGEPGRPIGHHGVKESAMRCEACHTESENLVRTGGLLRCAGGCRKTADEAEYHVEVDHGDGEPVTELVTDDQETAEQQADGFERGGADSVEISTESSMRTVAHDSGDGETIFHCPFCGSGQVTARSDGTVECGFCHSFFTVQVQPEFSSMPQTVNGQPVDDPAMPGVPGEQAPAEDEFAPAGSAAADPEEFAPAGSGAAPVDPEAFAPAGSRAASKQAAATTGPAISALLRRNGIQTSGDRNRESVRVTQDFLGVRVVVDIDDEVLANRVASEVESILSGAGYAFVRSGLAFRMTGDKTSALYVTADGVALPEESFLAHLALRLADDRAAVLEQVRAERGV